MFKRKESALSYWLLLLLAAVVYAGLSLSDLIWADEAYTFAMLRHSFSEIWTITAADVHPPLYYFLAKLVAMPFGYSEYAVRLFSGICYLLIIAIGGWQIGKFFNRKTGNLFMALFLLYPFALEHAVEARMYAPAALAVFLNGLFAYLAWRENRIWDWFGFAVAGVCAAYLHYFALVSVGIIYGLLFLCCLIKKRPLLKPWLAASLVTVALYLPWLKAFAEQLAFKVNNEYWIEPITIKTLMEYALSLLHANGHSAFPLFFGLLVGYLVLIMLLRKDGLGLLTLAVPVLTMVLGVGVSLLIRPIFIIRYLAPCAPLLIFFLAYGIGSFPRESLTSAAAAVLLVSFSGNFLFAAYDILPSENKFSAAFAQEYAQAEAYVLVCDNALHLSQVTACYQPETTVYAPETLGAASPYTNIQSLRDFSTDGLTCFLLLTDVGSGPDGMFASGFTPTLIGTYHDVNEYADVWLMEHNE